MTKANEIISFWFSEKCKKCWFDSSDELDELIKQNYEKLWQSAAQGDLDDWREQPMSALALVIILDQFPLNMYRDKAESFSTEDKSREIAQYAIEKNFHESFNDDQKKAIISNNSYIFTTESKRFCFKKLSLRGGRRPTRQSSILNSIYPIGKLKIS